MAEINVKTQILDREEIARFIPAKNFRLIKFFENLFADVGKTIPDAIGAAVEGPGVSVDNHVATFDGTTGFKIKDSGVDIVELAKLDSPAFTGVPTAPTAAPGTSTDQIATTAFVDAEFADGVTGPLSAVDSNIATFNGVTGKVIKDSGILVTDLAPLASPALTGNPTAPTAALNDNDTSIATTAFVQNQIESLTAAYFSAHNNGVAQSIPTSAYTKLTFSTEVFDVGNKFASSTWTPPAGRLVMLVGNVVLPTVLNGLATIAIFKNGSEFKRGNQAVAGGTNTGGVSVSCIDLPNGTDTYELHCFQGTGASQNTVGSSIQTYFQGTTIRP